MRTFHLSPEHHRGSDPPGVETTGATEERFGVLQEINLAASSTVGENEVGRNGPLPCHNTCCRMEVPRLCTWPPTLVAAARTTRSGPGVGAVHLHACLEPLQASSLLPVPHPEGPEETQQMSPSSTPPCSPVCEQRDESSRGTDAPRERSVSSRQDPLPDLLPLNEHFSSAALELEHQQNVRRWASLLRTMGDEFDDRILLRRANAGPPRRVVCGALSIFIAQMLVTFYIFM